MDRDVLNLDKYLRDNKTITAQFTRNILNKKHRL